MLLAIAVLIGSACAVSDRSTSPTTPAPASSTTAASVAVTSAAAAQRWQRIADIPTPRSEVAAAVFRDAIYVIGGFGGPNIVERYLPATDRWERQPDLPIGVDHPMAAAITAGPHAGVYVIGGNTSGGATARAFRLDPDTSRWREIAPMPAPRSAAAAVAIEDAVRDAPPAQPRIYVVGGANGAQLQAATLEYDPAVNAWRTRQAIPTPRDHLAGVRFEGGVCAIGGRELSLSRNLGAFECYDPARESWQRLPQAPTPRGGVGAAVVEGGTVFFIGGEQPSGTFREVEVFARDTRTWSRGPDLPTPRHGIGVGAFGAAVYVLSGGPTPGGSQTAVCEVLRLR